MRNGMHFYGRSLVAFLIIVLSFIPGTYSSSLSTGGGTSATISGGSSTEGSLATNGLDTQASVSSTGIIDDINMQHRVTNTIGDHVAVGVTATNAKGFSYDYATAPGEGNVGSNDAVSAQQWLSASSVDSLNAYSHASNLAGDQADTNLNLNGGSLNGYYDAAYVGTSPWTGAYKGAFAQQTTDKAQGAYILAMTWTTNPLQDATGTYTEVRNGALNEYSTRANAIDDSNGVRAAGVSLDSVSASAPSGSILQIMNAFDNKGDYSRVSTSIANGNLAGDSWAYSTSQGVAVSNQNINAEGSLIDVGAYTQNSKPGYEYLSYFDGIVKYFIAPGGTAQFEYKTSNELATNVNGEATPNNVLITPSLPAGTKTAIMLEPMYYAFTTMGGATDLGPTVAQTLAGKGYAVLRYTDSGASIDKFHNLDNYNVAVIDSHMDNQHIALSTYPGVVDATQLATWYSNPPSKSLVILAGCESFEGAPTYYSPLANAISKADVGLGFSAEVGTLWCNDYVSELITKMSEGMTVLEANDYVWNTYRHDWLAVYGYPTTGVIPLDKFGNGDFKL